MPDDDYGPNAVPRNGETRHQRERRQPQHQQQTHQQQPQTQPPPEDWSDRKGRFSEVAVQWRVFPVAPHGGAINGSGNVGGDDTVPSRRRQRQRQRCPKKGPFKWRATGGDGVWYEYRAGDQVLVVDSDRTNRERVPPDGAVVASAAAPRGRPGLQGTVVRVEHEMPPSTSSPSTPKDRVEDNVASKMAGRRRRYPLVHVKAPSSSSSSLQSSLPSSSVLSDDGHGGGTHFDEATLSFDPKEQQRLLQPMLCVATAASATAAAPPERAARCDPPAGPPPVTVVLVRETAPFRQLVRQLRSADRVLEIGCSTGELSKRVVPLVDSWVGLDVSQGMVDRCTRQLAPSDSGPNRGGQGGGADGGQDDHPARSDPNTATRQQQGHRRIKIVKVDALVEPQRAFQEATTPFGPPTVIFVDIGGNRECLPVLQILSWVFASFYPTAIPDSGADSHSASQQGGAPSSNGVRLVMIKSREMVELMKSAILDTGSSVRIDPRTGVATDGHAWFVAACKDQRQVQQQQQQQERSTARMTLPRLRHPLKAPLVLSPADQVTPICRYHNYHRDGCKLMRTTNDTQSEQDCDGGSGTYCALDHEHCHACRERGHVAKDFAKAHLRLWP